MLSRIYSAVMFGLKPIKVEVEVDSIQGKPSLVLIGLPTKTIDEAKERITSALFNCDIRIKARKTIVNLAPADIRKDSSALELAIAVALLKHYQVFDIDLDETIFFGELSLDGSLKKIRGALALVLAAREMGFKKVFIPQANADEVSLIDQIEIFAIDNLKDLIDFYQQKKQLVSLKRQNCNISEVIKHQVNFANIYGQQTIKRALQIAIAGGHNILLIGPPGSGKSLLARSLVSILPPLSKQELIEVNQIYSVAGLLQKGFISLRPFRSPHHSISTAALLGGGRDLRPGEISLAHKGVLFLDELTEFKSDVIESLRQPIEDKKINIVRAHGAVSYPCDFILVAAANPCRCGYLGSLKKECSCTPLTIANYQKKLSGPILDRIDIHLQVHEVELKALEYQPEDSLQNLDFIKQSIKKVRQIQNNRYEKLDINLNADLDHQMVKKIIILDTNLKKILARAHQKLNLTARSYFKIIKVARTIADLDQSKNIQQKHLLEAISYRSLF